MAERICWIVLALIHASPFAAFFHSPLITRLYGVARTAELFPLLHHRAALFGVVVIACLWAAADNGVARLCAVIVALSMLSFLAIWWANGSPPALRVIAMADLIGLPFLAYAAWRAYAA